METLKLTITSEKGRIDKVLTTSFPSYSRSQVQHFLKNHFVTVNDQVVKANCKVTSGDKICLVIPDPVALTVEAEDIPIDIVYEDDEVAVINKPQGMVVHPSAGHPNKTLVNALLYHLKSLSTINGVIRPGIVHRIDKDTSGLLMVAKTDEAHEHLSEQLKNHRSQRKYLAIVHGNFAHDFGKIEAPIARSKGDRKKQAVIEGGKKAVTHFEVLERFDAYTLLELQLETGRTHQIRVHMAYIGHPVAGDPLYGPRKTLKGKGQFLHAATLGFLHPKTEEEMTFSAEIPEIFQQTLEKLREEFTDE